MEFSQQFITIIDDLCKRFGIVLDWTSKNIMPYLEELFTRFIKFEIGTSIFHLSFAPLICLLFWIITGVFIKKAKKDEWDFYNRFMPNIAIAFIIISIVLSIATLIVIGCQIQDILQAIYLPEKTLYDFITYNMT